MAKAVNTDVENIGYFNPPNVYKPAILSIDIVGEYNPNDGAFNTYRITQNDGRIYDIRVKNGSGGSTGRGIADIDETPSTESSGINIIRITYTDGTHEDFQVRNGAKGEQGEQGIQGPAGIDSVTAEALDDGYSADGPEVVVGPVVDGVLPMTFKHLQGPQGEPAVAVTKYVTVEADSETTAATDVLPDEGQSDTVYRVANWDGAQYDDTAYSEYGWYSNAYVLLAVRTPGIDSVPTADSDNLVKSGGVAAGLSQLGQQVIYDVTKNNSTAGPNNDGKFESLSALLSDANLSTLIPIAIRCGGMSIRFVQTSDNKYVQFRCKTQSFSADPNDWYFCGEYTLVESPEWKKVVVDKNNNILYGVKIDGNFYFGVGCPPQVKEYVQEQINAIGIDGLLATKVDKETGKSLIDADYASSVKVIENPEWLKVITDSNGKILKGIKKDGKEYPCEDETAEQPEDKRVDLGNIISLSNNSSSVKIKFKTISSLYKQISSSEFLQIGGLLSVTLKPKTVGDSYYLDKSEADIDVAVAGSTTQTIPLKINNYGTDLFSLRIKYPVVDVALDGTTTMTTPMPAAYQGMYIAKTDTAFTIYNGNDSVYKSFVLSNYTDVDAFVEALKVDSDITDVFEIKKYGCEGVTFDEINNFEKIILCKEIEEVKYLQGSGTPTPTGNVYWDSYPTIIRSSDMGYEHIIVINYKVLNEKVVSLRVSVDGMFVRFKNLNISSKDLTLMPHLYSIIDGYIDVHFMPYNPAVTPMISMQHIVDVSEENIRQDMHTSTMRQYEMLSYLKKKGFVGVNYRECASIMKGEVTSSTPVYCLNFDDYQRSIWTTKEIRELFNQFRAKPSLAYLFEATDLDTEDLTPPSYALTKDEYRDAKASGWDVFAHGFCMYTPQLSYAQFYVGFNRLKECWMNWYGEDVSSYNPHGRDLNDYQYLLLKHMGFHTITAITTNLGTFCEAGTKVDVQCSRINWMDGGWPWPGIKERIDAWLD